MKSNVLIIVCFIFYNRILFSQMYIGPSLGMDISQISEPNESKPYFDINGNILSNMSLSYGILVEQSLSAKSIISIRSTYTKKKEMATTTAFFAIDKIQYSHVKNTLEFKYFLNRNWNIGSGLNLSFGNKQKVTYLTSDGQEYKFKETGLVFSSGIIINRFLFELLYYHSLSIKYDKDPLIYQIQPTKSIVLSASYLFKIREKSKSQKIECPRF